MRRPRTRRAVAAAVVVVATAVFAAQVLSASADETKSVDVAVVRLDSAGFPLGVTLNAFTRTYSDSGSKDSANASTLDLKDGLVTVNGDHRALPVVVHTHYFLNGTEVSAQDIAGKSGDFKVEWDVTNRTQKTEEVTYTDSVTGKEKTVTAATMVPFTVDLSGLSLPDASFDSLTSNGVLSRSSANDATVLSWTSVLAPPVFPGTANFTVEGKTNNFKLPETQMVATPGISGALPKAASDAAEKGGAATATVRGYIAQFGDGFAQLDGGISQLKGGLDQIFAGMNDTLKPGLTNTKFDKPLYAEDSTLAYNQPGLLEALSLLGDGLGTMITGAAQIRAGLKTGDASNPGVVEGLNQVISGIGQGNEFDGNGNPLTVRASLNALRLGISSGDVNAPGLVEGLQQISDAIGAGTEFNGTTPLTIRASINAVRAGLSSGDMNNPAIIEGLQTIYASIGNGTEFSGTTPLTVAAGLAAIHGALSSGDMNNPKIIEGLQTIYNSIGNGTEFDSNNLPLTLAASLAAVRAALSSGDANNPAILEGLQKIYAGIGAGNEFDGSGNPLTARATLNAIRGALSTGSMVDPGIIEGVEQVVAGIGQMKTQLDGFASTFVATVNGLLGPLALDLTQGGAVQGVLDTAVGQFKAALDTMSAGLESGDVNNPGVLEGLQKIYAGIGDGTEFDANQNPLTLMASMVAMRAGLSSGSQVTPGIIEGVQQVFAAVGDGSEVVNGVPKSIRAGVDAIRAGLSSGSMQNPAVIEGLQQILAAIGTGSEFNNGLPASLRASLNAIRAGLSSGDVNNPAVVEGLQQIYASLGLGNEFNGATPLTIQASLVALQQGVAQLQGGAQLAHDSIGTGGASDFGSDGTPLTMQAALVAMSSGVSQLVGGIDQIVAGLGNVDASGKPVKNVTTRTSKYGNVIETPADLLYALQSSKDAVMNQFVAGVAQIVDALGDPNVSAATILAGLKQVSDGLGLANGGASTGATGATTLSHVVSSSVNSADVATALHQAGVTRAEQYQGFGSASGDKHRTIFVFREGGVG
ncbi:MAG TPA: hypothetical protein VHC63_12375 [Acidimicrobiales bacterium]|nr:hypothetical protein [Acidimicrobiales bacterium]